MTNENLKTTLTTYKKGTFVRLRYGKTYSKGYTSETEVTSRLGCAYANLSGVTVKGKEDYASPVDADRIVYRHKTNGTLYVQHEPISNEVRKVKWFKDGKEVTEEQARTELPKSAFRADFSPVKRIKVENLISIG